MNNVYRANGNKISSILVDNTSIKTSSKYYNSPEAFVDAFNKKLSFDTKLEIKNENIRAIRNKDNSTQLIIDYKSKLGIVQGCEFELSNPHDLNEILHYYENEKHFLKSHKRKSPMKAASNSLALLVLVVVFYLLGIYRLDEIANGTAEGASGKLRLLDNIVGLLGNIGLHIICGIIGAVLIFLVIKHLSNPPKETKLVPRNFVS